MACSSSDESAALKEWFDDQVLATSYGKTPEEVPVSMASFSVGHNNSAYAIGSYAVLGDANGVEHTLYIDLDSLPSRTWALRADAVFYNDIYGGSVPEMQLEAEIYWLEETEDLVDSVWLKFERPFLNSAEIIIDNFSISLPEELPDSKLLVAIKLKPNSGTVLRIEPKSIYDISGLKRVAQKTRITDDCERCLYSGVGESLFVSFDKINIDKTVVFAQLVLPKQSGTAGSELELPIPVYAIGESYRVDTAYVNENKLHPNLIFSEGEDLKLQVTNSLRRGKFDFIFILGPPMLIPGSLYFYNSIYSTEKVFSDRPAYARYDFSAMETAKLRIWYAD
ncbi:MAG: hypothetical protein FWB90_09695 [Fibromonadales bacterium]|nr:hypothetical protein [Fibromonadales bacterium]